MSGTIAHSLIATAPSPAAARRLAAARTRRAHARNRERRRRAVLDALVLFLATAIVAAAVIPVLSASQADPESPDATRVVKVAPGQSLWHIARETAPPGSSTAQTVRMLRDMNGLETSGLSEGMLLVVPRAASAQVAAR